MKKNKERKTQTQEERAHKEALKIANKLVKKYNKRIPRLKKKGYKKDEIRKIFNGTFKHLNEMVAKIKV